MAGLLYDDYSLQYPGDFRVSEIALVSPYGNVVGITTNVTQLNIYEDIYQNCLTGDITFADTEDVVNMLPIIGNEYLSFKIRTPMESKYKEGEYDFTNIYMAVYKVETRTRLNARTEEIKLAFTSPENIRNQNIKISRAFDGPYDDAVAKIFKKDWGLNSKRKLYIQPTAHNFKFVAPNKRPLDIINMIASRAVPNTLSAPAYVFYENGQGFHFRSMDSFFYVIKGGNIVNHPDMFEYFPDTVEARGTVNVREKPKSLMRLVDKYNFSKLPDLIKSQRMGTYASKLITHDSYNKTFKTKVHNYIDEYNSFPHLERGDETGDQAFYQGLIVKAHYDPGDLSMADSKRSDRTAYKMISDYSDARLMVVSNTANIHTSNMAKGYRIDESLQDRQSSLQLFDTLEMTLEVPGNTHINIGHVIRVNIPRSGGDKRGEKYQDSDKYHSGRWLVTAIRHSFTFTPKIHKSVITCIKETYQRPLSSKMGAFQIIQKDEGNPVNISDDSEYK